LCWSPRKLACAAPRLVPGEACEHVWYERGGSLSEGLVACPVMGGCIAQRCPSPQIHVRICISGSYMVPVDVGPRVSAACLLVGIGIGQCWPQQDYVTTMTNNLAGCQACVLLRPPHGVSWCVLPRGSSSLWRSHQESNPSKHAYTHRCVMHNASHSSAGRLVIGI